MRISNNNIWVLKKQKREMIIISRFQNKQYF